MSRTRTHRRRGAIALLASVGLHAGLSAFAATTVVTVTAVAAWSGSQESAHIEMTVRTTAPFEPCEVVAPSPTGNEPPLLVAVEVELPPPEPAACVDDTGLVLPVVPTSLPPPDEAPSARAQRLAHRVPSRDAVADEANAAAEVVDASDQRETADHEAPSSVSSEASAYVAATEAGSVNAPPVYPESARLRGHQGVVTLVIDVDAEGNVVAIRIARSSGHAALDHAALRCLRRWTFQPARRGATAVACTIEKQVEFKIVQD